MSEAGGRGEDGVPRGAVNAILLATVFAAAIFVSRFVVFELLVMRLAVPAVLAAAQLLAAFAIGHGVRDLFARLTRAESIQPRVPDLVAGYPLFGAVMFLAGCVSTAPALQASILVIAAAAGLAIVIRTTSTLDTVAGRIDSTTSVLLVLSRGFALVVALLPPVSLDELAYHLTIPKIWANAGRAVDLPLMSHSYFPLGSESADLPLFAIATDAAPLASHLTHFAIAVAGMLLVWQTVRRWNGVAAGSLVTLIVATTPAILVAAGWSNNDLPLLACCVALILSARDDDSPAFASALAAGLLLKYTFYPFAAIIAVAWVVSRGLDRRRLVAVIGGGIAGSVFLIRNLLLTGNPFAPFLGAAGPHIAGFKAAATIGETLQSYVFDPRFVDDSLGVMLVASVLVSPFILLRRSVTGFDRMAGGGTLVLVVSGILLGLPARLLAPVAVGSAVLAFANLGTAAESSRRVRWSVMAGCALQLLLVLFYIAGLDPLGVVSGRVSDAEYVGRRATTAKVLRGDAMLPAASRTLVVGVSELFWFSHEVRGGANFDSARIASLLEAPDAAAIRRKLAAQGFTHLLVYPDGIRESGPSARQMERERLTILPAATIAHLQQLSVGRGNTSPIVIPLR